VGDGRHRYDAAATSTGLRLRLNNDSGSNYDNMAMYASGSTVSALEELATTSIRVSGALPGASAPANVFGGHETLIANYGNAVNQKTVTSSSSGKRGTATGDLFVERTSSFWRSNSAINRIAVLAVSGNLVAGTRVTIYGMGA
jgi:hypothetical protein